MDPRGLQATAVGGPASTSVGDLLSNQPREDTCAARTSLIIDFSEDVAVCNILWRMSD